MHFWVTTRKVSKKGSASLVGGGVCRLLRDRQRVVEVVLLRLDERLDELGRVQLDVVAGGDETACKRLRTATRFHADQTLRVLHHKLDELSSIELGSLRHVAAGILADDMKPLLAQIDTDNRRHHDRLLERRNLYDRKRKGTIPLVFDELASGRRVKTLTVVDN